ncbi:MAG: manganese-dependent inorganic pyrophosphatase [Sheuella sp.]|nr:manganese-dependent inorganic pyrophosphatase [Sheuella sp.]
MRLKIALVSVLCMLLNTVACADPLIVVGHKNPDSDSIFSAISLAHLRSQQGIAAVPVAQGKPNPETQFALDFFGLEAPTLLMKVAGRKVALVDHNHYAQAPDDIRQADIVEIIDHHNLGGVSTAEPIEVLIKPVGCTSTIIWQLYQRANISIPPAIAGGMLSAILSDTLIFRSPTTTDQDRAAAENLATIAHVNDIQKYGQSMFLAGEADLKTAVIHLLIHRDLKNFEMNDNKIAVAQLMAVSFDLLKDRKEAFLEEMRKLQKEYAYKTVILMLTDIKNEGTELLLIGKNAQHIAQAFNLVLKNDSVWIPGMMSRKKQMIPALEKVFDKETS